MTKKEQKQENDLVNSTKEDKKQKTIINAYGEEIVIHEINWNWGISSFYLSLIAVLLVIYYWLWLYCFHTNNCSGGFGGMELLVFVLFAIPIITLGVILVTGTIIISGRFTKLKDKYYALAGFIISIIVLMSYSVYFL